MNKIIKNILFFMTLVSVIALCGCKTDKNTNVSCGNSERRTVFGAFNDETYVWQQFYFSTNQVKDANK